MILSENVVINWPVNSWPWLWIDCELKYRENLVDFEPGWFYVFKLKYWEKLKIFINFIIFQFFQFLILLLISILLSINFNIYCLEKWKWCNHLSLRISDQKPQIKNIFLKKVAFSQNDPRFPAPRHIHIKSWNCLKLVRTTTPFSSICSSLSLFKKFKMFFKYFPDPMVEWSLLQFYSQKKWNGYIFSHDVYLSR